VWFTVKGWNYAHGALNVQFHVVNESGKVVYPQDGGWVSKYLPEGASNYTLDAFSWDVYGLGNHTYTLVARISGEEEKATTTVTIKPVNGTELKQVGFECDDPEFNGQDNSDVMGDIGVNVGVTIVLGGLAELPRAAKRVWDFIGPIIIRKNQERTFEVM